MHTNAGNVVDVAQAIQLSLSPVFLLMGVAGMLTVMTGRLARIVDRARQLTEARDDPAAAEAHAPELAALERRRRFVSIAITACTVAALLLCTVIIALFLDVMIGVSLGWLIGGLFVSSTLGLVVGWSYFLREVHFAATLPGFPVSKSK